MPKKLEPKAPSTWTDPAYMADCQSRAGRIRIKYADGAEWHEAVKVHTWKRDDAEVQRGPIGSSSGPKDYLKNDVFSIFQQEPRIDAVMLLVLNRTPFLIMRYGEVWFDRSPESGRQVIISKP